MELNGALSNPRVAVELRALIPLRERLLELTSDNPRRFRRPVPSRALPISDTITAVLRLAEEPMKIPEIRAAVEVLGEPLSTKRIKEALSAGTFGRSPRFRRIRRGVYEAASLGTAQAKPATNGPRGSCSSQQGGGQRAG
jgi:hypothetical protein